MADDTDSLSSEPSTSSFVPELVTNNDNEEEHISLQWKDIRLLICTRDAQATGERGLYATDLLGNWVIFQGELDATENSVLLLGNRRITVVKADGNRKPIFYDLNEEHFRIQTEKKRASDRPALSMRRERASAVGEDTWFVICGGKDHGSIVKHPELYLMDRHNLETWITKEQKYPSGSPILARYGKKILSIRSKIPAAGKTIAIEVCDLKQERDNLVWKELSHLPVSVRSVVGASGAVHDGKLYLLGGQLDAMWVLDLSNDVWTELPPPPHAHAVGCAGFQEDDGRKYILFAVAAEGKIQLDRYDIDGARWIDQAIGSCTLNGESRVEAMHIINRGNAFSDFTKVQKSIDSKWDRFMASIKAWRPTAALVTALAAVLVGGVAVYCYGGNQQEQQ